MLDWKPKKLPWEPADFDLETLQAVRAMVANQALPHQQQRFWMWLMYVTGAGEGFDDLSFRPDDVGGPRATDFAEGKRFVGLQVRKMLRPEALALAKAMEEAKTGTGRR